MGHRVGALMPCCGRALLPAVFSSCRSCESQPLCSQDLESTGVHCCAKHAVQFTPGCRQHLPAVLWPPRRRPAPHKSLEAAPQPVRAWPDPREKQWGRRGQL